MPNPETRQRQALALLWITPALWSVNYIIARKAPAVVTPHLLALGRWGLAGLLLAWLVRQELWTQRRAVVAAWPQHLALGTLGMLICGAWVYLGARTTGAMNIALIYAASPVLIALGAWFWLGERLWPRQMLGVALALAGVMHVIVQGRWLALAQVSWVPGDVWIVLAMLSWAGYALLLKKWTSPLSAQARLASTCAGGVAVLLPFALWELGLPDTPAWGGQATALVVVAALVPGIGAYLAYGHAQKVLGASRVAASLYLGPLYAALAAWGVLGEPMGLHHAVGAALILPGIFLASSRPLQR
ncbi:DMT family transporter [Ramlibacter sp. 2FC]|uniref:DMT family transporter n=1 Tax=Ramlibacter sp. 2FC TaxID=2502188 RepID=UPI0010F578F7|nr:DMT family transporter [Ramlibacter sp. 2FC]